jgi:hypothetical protein
MVDFIKQLTASDPEIYFHVQGRLLVLAGRSVLGSYRGGNDRIIREIQKETIY